MTQHPSLKSGGEESKFRSVLKRFERIRELASKDKWNEEKDSVFKLPKVKRIKFKTKKTKGPEEDEEGAVGAEGAVAAEGAAPAEGAAAPKKEGAPGKEGAAPPKKGK